MLVTFSAWNLNATDVSTEKTDQFNNLLRNPDRIRVVTDAGLFSLQPQDSNHWNTAGVSVRLINRNAELVIELASSVAMKQIVLEWNGTCSPDTKFLGDAWERAYGDLQWRPLEAARVMPWYFLANTGTYTHGYGVKTGPAALCHWTVTSNAITLHCDVRSGGVAVELKNRTLTVASVVVREGHAAESPFAAARDFCRMMCASPRLPKQPVYGFNDWYCAYGSGTAKSFLTNAAYIVSLSPTNNPPFAVVDDGWQVKGDTNAFPWSRTNPHFSSTLTMGQFAQRVRDLGARPGIWVRPLQAFPNQPAGWRLSHNSRTLDPTVPAVREYIRETIGRLRGWRYELIKHDFTTYEITGLWGKDMAEQMTPDGWAFSDRSRTTAEIVSNLYGDIRDAAGDEILIIGCNTIGHLAAGVFQIQRIGDDTSGRDWERVRKMGINSLAFRGPQHDAFFAVDADCAGEAASNSTIPWSKNIQWLQLLGRSGTPCFVSFPREIITSDREPALRAALAAAAQDQPMAIPLDWMETPLPNRWQLDGDATHFLW